ncbi:DNA-directed RNA polymerase I subunit rpa1 [Babesia sp. Xinjiang]|uniref:DNA-directed RNA polymerase I subunit rpa1 n=1 Tax=Babesia sp. Xinjiang TaxID=462227 RepID=UPI000A239702|nr:DNA-directed RNA polymerase I subunit rpa1 [Babesia sp. Xinjiang]ORM39587.1 DNA-directed RNA polymerase I subunit rpa1 [Babesia sp. Xinjiang]
MLKYETIVSTEVTGLSFEFLPAETIRKMSVSEISNTGHNGEESTERSCIHDSALGPSDLCNICSTCNEVSTCDGHMGHINFPLPLYHPLLLPRLTKLIKGTCLYCRRLKLPEHRMIKYVKLFDLLHAGLVSDMLLFDDWCPDTPKHLVLEESQKTPSRAAADKHLDDVTSLTSLGSITSKEQYLHEVMSKLDSKRRHIPSETNNRTTSIDCNTTNDGESAGNDLDGLPTKKAKSMVPPSTTGKGGRSRHFDMAFWNELRNRFLTEAGNTIQCHNCKQRDVFLIKPSNEFSSIEISWPYDIEEPPIIDYLASYQWNAEGNDITDLQSDATGVIQGLVPPVLNRLSVTGRSVRQIHLQAFHVVPYIQELFKQNKLVLSHIFPQSRRMGWKMFMMFCMGVPANRFRPVLATAGRRVALHARSSALLSILSARETVCALLKIGNAANLARCLRDTDYAQSLLGSIDDRQVQAFRDYIVRCGPDFETAVLNAINSLQNKIAVYSDGRKSLTAGSPKAILHQGIKQALEKKDGAVRHNMLGKRVNYAARTVIAPDCFLDTNQMGIPLMFATELTIPENVTSYNVNLLRRLLVNGPRVYPGANFYRDEHGKLYNLGALTFNERKAKAKLLMTDSSDGKLPRVVYRHVLDGDVVLMNRQPTLHKPGIMAHFVKVLTNQKIFRLNYVNCNTYNADFDGDEMNLHLPQDPLAQSEARLIINADCQFTVPKDGQPIRGLIQDHCIGGAYLTCRDTFLTRDQYFNLVYVALQEFFRWDRTMYIRPETGIVRMQDGVELDIQLHQLTKRLKILSDPYARRCANRNTEIHLEEPAIIFPQFRWTGKQVITTILKTIVDGIAQGLRSTDVNFLRNYKGINLVSKSKTPGDAWGGVMDGNKEEGIIIIRNSELLQGVLDKSQFGSTPYGLTHLVYELLGPRASGCLLNAFSYLFTSFLQMHGVTCSPMDFILTCDAERDRNRILRRIKHGGIHLQQLFISAFSNGQNDVEKTESGTHRSSKEVGSDSLSIFKKMYDQLKDFPALKSELRGVAIESLSDMRNVLGIVSKYLDKNTIVPESRRKLAAIVSSSLEALCAVPELRGFVLGQMPRVAAIDKEEPLANENLVMKQYPSWQKNYDMDVRASRNASDRCYTLGDSSETCSSLYSLINERFKGNEKVFYKMFDRFFQGNITGASSEASNVVDRTLLKFPQNGFAGMVLTGAKGSKVNFSMICSLLAQQSLEGRRVPVMPSVRTLPSFAFGDLGSRAGGFITDRFLTGLRPQEYFFHCMSGREGLVDTCVKTAKSGYLQRCVLKAMEDVICCYDSTVRSCDGTIIQFAYGEDGIDVQKSAYLKRPKDIVDNAALVGRGLGDTPLKFESGFSKLLGGTFKTPEVQETLYRHYKRSKCDPGEAVGCVAAQSIGEPATQMTLNTFHLAGHGATNVTLGIPRLVEILQTTGNASTPYFSAPLLGNSHEEMAQNAQVAINALRTVPLTDVIHSVAVEDAIYVDANGEKFYEYEASVQFEDLAAFQSAVDSIDLFTILRITAHCLLNGFLRKATGLMIVTMDSNVLCELTENSDYLQECWRRLVLMTALRKRGKLATRIRKMALLAGGSKDAALGTSTAKMSLYTGEGMENASSTSNKDDAGSDDEMPEPVETDEIETAEPSDTVDDDPDQEKNSDHEDSDPESQDDSDIDGADAEATSNTSDEEKYDSALSDSGDVTAIGTSTPSRDVGTVKVNNPSSVSRKKQSAQLTNPETPGGETRSKDQASMSFENDIKRGKQAMSSLDAKVFHFAKSLRYCAETGRMVLKFGWPFKKCPYHLNFLPLLRQETSAQLLRNSPGVRQARVVCTSHDGEEVYNLYCDGTNLQRLFLLKEGLVDLNRIRINDIATVLRYYGVEAARASIVSELQNVFSVYGINVDYRHLSLIADFMTNRGDIRTFNRYGMAHHSSPLLQMSFESTTKFMMDACERGGYDNLGSPAGAIIAGRPVMLGGGLCKVLPQVDLRGSNESSARYPSSAYDQQVSASRRMGVESFVLDG